MLLVFQLCFISPLDGTQAEYEWASAVDRIHHQLAVLAQLLLALPAADDRRHTTTSLSSPPDSASGCRAVGPTQLINNEDVAPLTHTGYG